MFTGPPQFSEPLALQIIPMHSIMSSPLSPMLAYPFSLLMVPLYVSLILERVTASSNHLSQHSWSLITCAVALFITASNTRSLLVIKAEIFETYRSWNVGVTWNLFMWSAVIVL